MFGGGAKEPPPRSAGLVPSSGPGELLALASLTDVAKRDAALLDYAKRERKLTEAAAAQSVAEKQLANVEKAHRLYSEFGGRMKNDEAEGFQAPQPTRPRARRGTACQS